ncbi:MAG: hypothetical protein ACI4CS_00840 [Candidatus Weimeria sp.]
MSYISRFVPVIAAVLAALAIYIIRVVAKMRKQKKERIRLKKEADRRYERMNKNIQDKTAEFNALIRKITDKAVSYGDIVTPDRLTALIDQVQKKLDAENDYDNIMEILSCGMEEAVGIQTDMEEHEKSLEEDLREEENARAEKRKELPFIDTKYFRSCRNIPQVKHMFRQLAKIYHPDAGGDVNKYMAIYSEYKAIVKGSKV